MVVVRILLFALFLFSITTNTSAVITPIAITGDPVPGLPGAQYASLGNAQLNAHGHGVYSAVLQVGPGDITSANDTVLISLNGSLTLNAQTGSDDVVGVPGASYASFKEFKVADSGDVLLKAILAGGDGVTGDNNKGFWNFSDGTGSLITRTGSSSASGVPNATYFDLGAKMGMTPGGGFAFDGQLTTGSGVSSNNDFGIWQYEGSVGTLVARENMAAPDVIGGLFHSFGSPALNTSDQMTFRGGLKPGAGLTAANRTGIWFYNEGAGELLARNGSAEVPGSTSDYVAFDDPLINEVGQVVFRATLATGQQGLWRYSGTEGTNLAMTNVTGIPGLPTASFGILGKPLLTESGKVVASATLTTDVGGIVSSNDTGLWLFDKSNGDQLLAREGTGGVAGILGASFASFEHFAAIDDTGIYVNATLQPLSGIVDSTNDEGIWRIAFDGSPELILRKGASLAGRTVADLWLPAGELDEAPLTGISNASGELLFHASFTNGDSGLFLYSPSSVTEFAAADFDQDGDVDSADLATWKNAYGVTTVADANDDGDSNGADFLTWQRQYTGPHSLVHALSVPEPSVSFLLVIAFVIAQSHTRRNL
jgi:hypothetical protein